MHSPFSALSWEIWAAHRRGFQMLLLLLAGCLVLFQAGAGMLEEYSILRGLTLVPLFLSLGSIFYFCNYTENDAAGRSASYPSRLFLLPVSNAALVTSPMLTAVVLLLAFYVAWAVLVFWPLGIEAPIFWPAILLSTGMLAYQSLLWTLGGFRTLRLLAISTIGSLLITLAVVGLVKIDGGELDQPVLKWATPVLCLVIIGSYGLARVSVSRQRYGSRPISGHWHALLWKVLDAWPQRQRPFASAASAQSWWEWRRNGVALPALVLLMHLLVFGPVLCIWGGSKWTTAISFVWILLLPLVLTFWMGPGLGMADMFVKQIDLPRFFALQPMQSGELVFLKYRIAALSALFAWLITAAFTSLWFWLWCDVSKLAASWNDFIATYAPATRPWIAGFLVFTLILTTWRSLICGSCAALPGRSLFLYAWTVFVFILVAFSCIMCALLTVDRTWNELATIQKWFFARLPWIVWALTLLFVVKAWLSVWAWQRCLQCGLVFCRAVLAYLTIWLLSAGCLGTLACLLFLPDPSAPVESAAVWMTHIPWLRYISILGALLFVPLLRPAVAPLLLAWNRHR